MKLLVEELLAVTLSQTITVNKRIIVDSIRPRLYLHDDPAGTFTLSIKQGATTLGSKSLTMADIKTNAGFADNQFHHGFFRFQFANQVVLNPGTYTVELSSSGYTFAEASYLGWIIDHEDLTNTITPGDTVISDIDNPLTMQIWSHNG